MKYRHVIGLIALFVLVVTMLLLNAGIANILITTLCAAAALAVFMVFLREIRIAPIKEEEEL